MGFRLPPDWVSSKAGEIRSEAEKEGARAKTEIPSSLVQRGPAEEATASYLANLGFLEPIWANMGSLGPRCPNLSIWASCDPNLGFLGPI